MNFHFMVHANVCLVPPSFYLYSSFSFLLQLYSTRYYDSFLLLLLSISQAKQRLYLLLGGRQVTALVEPLHQPWPATVQIF